MLNETDERRLGRMIRDFIERSEIPLPLYLIAIGANGTVVVSRHTESGNEAVCASPGALTTPVTVTAISVDGGGGAAARIEFEAARPTMQ